MQAIIIGAGRGARLMPTTAEEPKCFAKVGGRRILDWIVEAFRASGIEKICFIGGYKIEKVQNEYPDFVFEHNSDWPNNNILASLFCAERHMDEPFVCCYSDILFTSDVATRLLASDDDIALGVDTDWLTRYEHRTEHPADDAEKVTVANGCVTRIHRGIEERTAYGEFIGVGKFSALGAASLRKHYAECRTRYAGAPFREAKVFEKAYLIHLLQHMIESGEQMTHVDTPGGYIEIDTQQDFEYAQRCWKDIAREHAQ